MTYFDLLLRVVHILAGIMWVGGGIASVGFINPSAKALKQDAAAFMGHLNFVRQYPLWLGVAGIFSALTGMTMYWRIFGDQADLTQTYPLVLSLGGLAGLMGLGMGLGMMRPVGARLEALIKEIAAGGGPPSPEQAAQMGELQEKLTKYAVWTTLILILAALLMSSAKILPALI